MKAHDAIKHSIDMGENITQAYVGDLSDADLLRRPAPACNHINWQLGHLIASEHGMISKVAPQALPPLPAGFAEKYTPDTAKRDEPGAFCSKAELLEIHARQRAGTLAALAAMSDADLDKPSGNEWAPTVGAAFNGAAAGHWLMHVGQWAVVRRQLGRAPLF